MSLYDCTCVCGCEYDKAGIEIANLDSSLIVQFSLTPGKIGLAFFAGTAFYIISAPLLGRVADKTVSQVTINY